MQLTVIHLRCGNLHENILHPELPILVDNLSPLDDGPGIAAMAVLMAAGVPPGGEVPGGVVLLELEHVVGNKNPLFLAFSYKMIPVTIFK